MSSLNTLTGRKGKFVVGDSVAPIARTTNWAVNPTQATNSEWGDSDSAGFTNRAAGRKDNTFTAEGKYDSTSEVFDLFQPEDIAMSSLWMSGDVADLYWHFPRALNTDFNLTVDIDSEEVIGWTSAWGADGIFYKPGADPGTQTIP